MITHQPAGYLCPFCQIAQGIERDEVWTKKSDIIVQTAPVTAFIAARWWPNNPGHVLVIPNVHYENVYDIPDDLLGRIQAMGKRIALAMKAAYGCDGISFRQHNEPAGNQDVWHYHLHVFPRYHGDDLYLLRSRTTTPDERKTYADLLRRELIKRPGE